MNTLAATFSQLRAPSAKTIVISLLQTLAFGAMLYVVALICASISEVVADQEEVVQTLCRWAWIASAPFYAMAISIKLTADTLGDASIASNAWLRMRCAHRVLHPGRLAHRPRNLPHGHQYCRSARYQCHLRDAGVRHRHNRRDACRLLLLRE